MKPENMPYNILMLEFDQDDRFITSSMISEYNDQLQITFVNYSHELFGYLDDCRIQSHPYPALILINYHATPLNGKEILQQLKADSNYHHIPIIILSGSNNEALRKECYALGASSFIQKPDSAQKTRDKIAGFLQYWFETVEVV